MRSELVYSALTRLPNRYQLCRTASLATRRLHIPSTATESTINKVLAGIGAGSYGATGEILPVEEVAEIRKAVQRKVAVLREEGETVAA